MGSTKKYLELIKQHKGEAEDSSQVLDEPWPRQTRRFVLTLGGTQKIPGFDDL